MRGQPDQSYGFRFHPHYDTGFLDRGKEHAREVDPFVRRGSGEVISRKTYLSVLSRISVPNFPNFSEFPRISLRLRLSAKKGTLLHHAIHSLWHVGRNPAMSPFSLLRL